MHIDGLFWPWLSQGAKSDLHKKSLAIILLDQPHINLGQREGDRKRERVMEGENYANYVFPHFPPAKSAWQIKFGTVVGSLFSSEACDKCSPCSTCVLHRFVSFSWLRNGQLPGFPSFLFWPTYMSPGDLRPVCLLRAICSQFLGIEFCVHFAFAQRRLSAARSIDLHRISNGKCPVGCGPTNLS